MKKWRSIIANSNFNRKDLLENPSYGPLRELLKEDVRKEIERPPTQIRIEINSPINNYDRDLLLKEIARIEKEWDLI